MNVKWALVIIAAALLMAAILSACLPKPENGVALPEGAGSPVNSGDPLMREDFNFYDGVDMIDADDNGVYGGTALPEGWSTARGFRYGGDIQEFALLYEGLSCIMTVTGVEEETMYYPRAEINETVNEISEENCNSVSFVFVFEGYTLTFDYSALKKEFEVTTQSLTDNSRFQALSFIVSICQYQLFGPYPDLWIKASHLPWADNGVDEIEYLNLRNDTLDEDEKAFMFEQAEAFIESYGLPPGLDEQRSFLSSLSDADSEKFDQAGLKIWNWVQAGLD